MTIRDRVFKSFQESLEIDEDIDTNTLIYKEYAPWTSIGHMMLVAALEAEFNTMLETDDILAMSSFENAVKIMSKYSDG